MSEEIKTNTENAEYDATQRWDDLAEEMDWLEDQAKNGDEATRAKAAKYIAQNIEYMSKILKEIDKESEGTEDKEVKEELTSVDYNELSNEERKAGGKQYQETIQNPDGRIEDISADTYEELQEQREKIREANKEAFSRY